MDYSDKKEITAEDAKHAEMARIGSQASKARWVIEDNIIEVAIRYYNYYGNLTGIPFYCGRPFPPEYTAREAVIRNNVLRNVDDAAAPYNSAMEIGGCENLLIEENVVASNSLTPIRYNNSVGLSKTFNNLSPDGKLIRASNAEMNGYLTATEIADIEEILILALLKTTRRL